MAYLIHYNKNHSGKDGRFIRGDGDGDGIANDHAHAGKKDGLLSRIGSSEKSGAGMRGTNNTGKSVSTPSKKKYDYSLTDEHKHVLGQMNESSKSNSNEGGKKYINSQRDNYVDEQKVTSVQAGNIYVTRNLGSSLIDLYEEDEEEKKRKKKRLLQQTTLDGKTLKEEPVKKKQHMGYTNIKQTYKLKPKK